MLTQQKRGAFRGFLLVCATAFVALLLVTHVIYETSLDAALPSPEVKGPNHAVPRVPPMVLLPVPYIAEAPEGKWVGPWKNGCEEASLAMVKAFYEHKSVVTADDAQRVMNRYFKLQDERWGSNANADAVRMEELSVLAQDFSVRAVEHPTVESIEAELFAGHPVIALLNGKRLGNRNIPFLANGSYYHVLVVVGYDREKREFITNDDGDEKEGQGRRYGYELFLGSLADYNFKTKKADGAPVVLFTAPGQKENQTLPAGS